MYCNLKDDLVGRILKGVSLSEDKQTLTIDIDGAGEKRYGVEGNCCSSSWIEYLEIPDGVLGSKVIEVEELSMDESDENKKHCDRCKESDCLQVYQTLIKTEKGTISLEYRNDSNGYYGGYLVSL